MIKNNRKIFGGLIIVFILFIGIINFKDIYTDYKEEKNRLKKEILSIKNYKKIKSKLEIREVELRDRIEILEEENMDIWDLNRELSLRENQNLKIKSIDIIDRQERKLILSMELRDLDYMIEVFEGLEEKYNNFIVEEFKYENYHINNRQAFEILVSI